MGPGEAVVVLVTVPTAEVAEKIGRTVVEERLAASVNIVPGLRSLYVWQGRLADERELLLLVKTRAERVAALETRVRALHPYAIPGVIAVPVVAGHGPYLAWIGDAVTKGGGEPDQE